MLKPLTKQRNKKVIMVYFALSMFSAGVGLYYNNFRWYIIAVALLLLALFRKFWLMKKLKE